MSDLEIWESAIPGRVSVTVTNSRGNPQTASVMGKGNRLRISASDREVAEEQIRDPQNNPFRNGMLYQVGGPAGEASADALSDDDLAAVFEMTGDEFANVINSLSEVNVRRLKNLTGPIDASRSQVEMLDQVIAERFPVGGDTPSYREMQGAPI